MNEDPTTPADGELSEDDLDAVTGGTSLSANAVIGGIAPNAASPMGPAPRGAGNTR